MKKYLFLIVVLASLSTTWALNSNKNSNINKATKTGHVVEVVRIDKQILQQKVPLLGTVFALNSVEIKPESAGKIKSIHVTSGQIVKEGTVLVELDNRHQLAVVKREKARLIDYQRQYQNYQALFNKGAVTQTMLESAETQWHIQQAELLLAEAALQDKNIIAPFSGKIGLIDLSRGQLVSTDTILTTLDDASTLRLNVPIASRHLPLLSTKQQIQINSATLNGKQKIATLSSIDSRINQQNLNVYLQFTIDNHDLSLTPGSLVTADLHLDTQATLLIPLQAVVYQGEKRFVYRVEEESVKKIEVSLGGSNAQYVQVLTGLSLADTVVYKGTVKLYDGAMVEIKP